MRLHDERRALIPADHEAFGRRRRRSGHATAVMNEMATAQAAVAAASLTEMFEYLAFIRKVNVSRADKGIFPADLDDSAALDRWHEGRARIERVPTDTMQKQGMRRATPELGTRRDHNRRPEPSGGRDTYS